MDDFIPLLLDVWREACRHIEIGESVARIAPVLAERLPLDRLLVRRIDLERSCVETVAAGSAGAGRPPASTRNDCSADELDRLIQWCRREEVLRGPTDEVRRQVAGLVPAEVAGHVLAGPLVGRLRRKRRSRRSP